MILGYLIPILTNGVKSSSKMLIVNHRAFMFSLCFLLFSEWIVQAKKWILILTHSRWRSALRSVVAPTVCIVLNNCNVISIGGYCKEYTKGKRPVGVMLDDTWFLRMTLATEPTKDPLTLKWEKRKKTSTAYAPPLRSGAPMALWAAKGMGVLFGGVSDEDTGEETLESVFFNDLYVSLSRCATKFFPLCD